MRQFRNRYRHGSGEYRWLEWTSNSVPQEGMIFAVARDITDRVLIERELVAREERERAILDNTTAVVYVKGTNGKYQFVNRRYTDLFRLERASVIGRSDREIFPAEIAVAFEGNDHHVLETAETITIEETVPHPDGLHKYISVKFPLFDGSGAVGAVAGISTDITDQLRAREADEQMRLARVFQQKLYPDSAPWIPGLDVAGWALPVSQVCGDYFDYIRRDEGRLVVSLGDVSGHGFGPALQMVEVRATLRILLRTAACLHEVVEELNRILCVDLPESSFVSLFLAEIDAQKRELRHVGAGHQALLLKADGCVVQLDSTGPLLGIDDSATFVEPAALAVEVGDLVVLFTDGLTEAMSLGGVPYGTRRLRESVSAHHHESSQSILKSLFEDIYRFASGNTIQDDMTAITVKVAG